MIHYVTGLAISNSFSDNSYPHLKSTGPLIPLFAKSLEYQRIALWLNKNSDIIRWSLARSALSVGDVKLASEALRPIQPLALHHPIMYHDALSAFVYAGNYDDAIALDHSPLPSRFKRPANDVLALAYIEKSKSTANISMKQQLLKRVLSLHPGDIYANYQLWQWTIQTRSMQQAAIYVEDLQHFPIEAIRSGEPGLINQFVELIPTLLERELWQYELGINVTSYLVWQYYELDSVEQLLRILSDQYPQQYIWQFFLGELYQRRKDWTSAEKAFDSVLQYPDHSPEVYLRLGMIYEAKCGNLKDERCPFLQQAKSWYEQYLQLVPDDLMGTKRLEVVYQVLSANKQSIDKNNDRQLIAELLGVSPSEIAIGSNLVLNGGFESWTDSRPIWWTISNMATGEPWNEGLFFNYKDELIGWNNTSARIAGMWLRQQLDKEPGRSGFWQFDINSGTIRTISVEPMQPYLISFYYRTDATITGNSVAMWVSYDSTALFKGDLYLPPTRGRWQRFIGIAWNTSATPKHISPLIRSFSTGQVWIDNIEIRSLDISRCIAPQPLQFRIVPRE